MKLLGRDAAFRSSTVLSGEKIALQRGNLELRATAKGSGFQVETLRFDSDFAEFNKRAEELQKQLARVDRVFSNDNVLSVLSDIAIAQQNINCCSSPLQLLWISI